MGEKLKEAAQGSAEAFSKRAFGASIGLSSGALSEILSGKRKLTLKTAGRIVELLDFGEKEKVQLLEVADPPKMESEVAERLGISLKEATETLTLLQSYNYISKSDTGDYNTLSKPLATTDNISSKPIAERHRNNLRLGLAALSKISVQERDFTSLTCSANSSQLDTAKKEIRKFLDALSDNKSQGTLDQVYQMSIQLYPIVGWKKSE